VKVQTEPRERRFTPDGSDAVETHLARTCERVRQAAQALVPPRKIEGLVLAGGYGRGQGGVLRTETGDQPYNDLEFYLFLRGNRCWNEFRHSERLRLLGERLSHQAGVHVEFKIDSLARLRRSPVSMFTYDLVSGHRILSGDATMFDGCEHHRQANQIPLCEATRLLFNRFTGLLFVKDLLKQRFLTAEQADFIARNLAKAQLAFGDAILTVSGRYHWSCLERHERLTQLTASAAPAGPVFDSSLLEKIKDHHAAGVEFKLHPRPGLKTAEEFRQEHQELAGLALRVWLWLESHRLHAPFSSALDYGLSRARKCPETAAWRNFLVNLRSFRVRALGPMAFRYPRERLFNALSLLLWTGEELKEPEVARRLRRQLLTQTAEWNELAAAYKRIWLRYG
jgi:hypothetical protein